MMAQDIEHEGRDLAQRGYTVIPIRRGAKRPAIDKWQKTRAGTDVVDQFIESGHGEDSVGVVLTDTLGALDIDCHDKDISRRLYAALQDLIWDGKAPARVGQAPKLLVPLHTSTGMRKRKSAIYVDSQGRNNAVEFLAQGQQFVAYGPHPSGKDYTWKHGDLASIDPADLGTITPEDIDTLFRLFEDMADQAGWTKASDRTESLHAGGVTSLENYRPPHDVTDGEVKHYLAQIKHLNEDHDTWVSVGMALYHQYDGDMQGFDLWDDW